jgi:hypothetical protein
MATNKHPWSRNIHGASKPYLFPGKVQAGATAAIKAGEICIFNETAGYWVPVNAAADYIGPLAVANEEQKVADLARYMEFIAPREGDIFEFALSAAAAVALGDALIISDSQTLTRDLDGLAVGFSVSQDNFPEAGTTLTSKGFVEMVFNPAVSYFNKVIMQSGLKRVLAKATAYTIKLEDNGAIFTNFGAEGSVTLTGPTSIVPVGFNFQMVVAAAQAFVFDPKPDAAAVIIKGGVQTAGKYVSVTDEGDFMHFVWDGTNWICTASPSGADADITVEG